MSSGRMVSSFPFPDKGGVFRAGFPLSSHPLHCLWAVPGMHEWTKSVTLGVSCPSDPPEAGAVWRAGWPHCPVHL